MSPPALRVTAAEAAAAMNGALRAGNPDLVLSGWSIDSRTIGPGDLFFAIRGDRFDGHDFVEAAQSSGAAGVVVSRPVEQARGVVIQVDDTTRALQSMARHVRRLSGARVIAITGSAGKTTTKEATAEFLSARYRVFRNEGNLNNHIGLPLSLLALASRPEVAVVELGMNHAGEIRTLVGIAEPDVRVWTNVAPVHTAFFRSLDDVADAKAEILDDGGGRLLVANADDPLVMARVARFAGKVVTFGLQPSADVRAERPEDLGLGGMRATLEAGARRATLQTRLLGRPNLANILAATAVALEFEVPLEAIVDRAARLAAPRHRGEVSQLADGITLVDDSYNSNPRALTAMLDVIRVEAPRRTIAVLGQMLELGPESRELHRACGRAAARAGVAAVVTVGGDDAQALGEAAAEALPPGSVQHAGTSRDAAVRVLDLLRPGDLVFVKGSRSVRTDVVVDRLKQEKG